MFQPIYDRVLIRPDAIETVTATGLHIPVSAQDTLAPKGTVVAIGEEVKYVEPGDRVAISPYEVVELTVEGENLLLVKEEQIFGYSRGE